MVNFVFVTTRKALSGALMLIFIWTFILLHMAKGQSDLLSTSPTSFSMLHANRFEFISVDESCTRS